MTLHAQPLVSVVTPVYNGDRYLVECIESVLAQTYENWEYTIVNNCSTDRSLEIAQHCAQQDDRIRVHDNTEFLTLQQNWSHALRRISDESKYCKVVHADDWIFPNCVSEMVELAERYPSVGIVGSYVLEGSRVKCDGLPYPSTIVSGRDICRVSLLGGIYVFGSPTSLLIRSSLIRSRNAFYDESFVQTVDQEACYNVLQRADFGFVHQVLSFTRQHDESQTAASRRLDRLRLEKLALLMRYGPVYLDDQEYERCLAQRVRGYYVFLGRNLLQRRGKEFWDYHREGLRDLGLPLSWTKLTMAMAKELYLRIASGLAHPKATARRTVGRLKHRM